MTTPHLRQFQLKEYGSSSYRSATDTAPLFEVVAEEVFRRYGQRWKPTTATVNRSYLRNQILPWFRGRSIASITRRDVQGWLASRSATPAAANRSLPILSVIMGQAETYGYRPVETNPCAGVRRYRQRGRERFLTVEELRRLGETLAQRESFATLPAAIVRLLLLTGCRQERNPGAPLDRIPRRTPVPGRQQDRAADSVVVGRGSRGPRRPAPYECLDIPGRERQWSAVHGNTVRLVASRARGRRAARRPAARPASQLRQLRPAPR